MTAMKRFSGEQPEKRENTGKSPVGKQRSPRKDYREKSWKTEKKSDDRPSGKEESGERRWARKERSFDKPWKKDDNSDRPFRTKTYSTDKQSGKISEKSNEKTWKTKKDDSGNYRDRKTDNSEKTWKRKTDESGYSSKRKSVEDDKPWKKREDSDKKPWDKGSIKKTSQSDRSWPKREQSENKSWRDNSRAKSGDSDKQPWNKRETSGEKTWHKETDKATGNSDRQWKKQGGDEKQWGRDNKEARFRKSGLSHEKEKFPKRAGKSVSEKSGMIGDEPMRLNKYIANAGICSRREADTMIQAGAVMVNGKTVTELGSKVNPGDKVQIGDETLNPQKKIYLLLNKPKGYITTVDDPQERNTVMMLVKDACRERIYPVGRLDRNTSGLLLMTNDGEIAKKLTHPSHRVRKIYQVELNKSFAKADMLKMTEGIELEDGMMTVDEIAYTGPGDDKKSLGVVIHSGKNRIVRRMFEALDYEVVKLDRVAFANLTKKDLPRGRWRFLEDSEVNMLKMI